MNLKYLTMGIIAMAVWYSPLAGQREEFVLTGGPAYFIIEHSHAHEGLVPVILFVGELRLWGVMDGDGRVFPDKDLARNGLMPPLFSLDPAQGRLACGKKAFLATSILRSPDRTRLLFSRPGFPLCLSLDLEKGRGELRVGEGRLTLAVRAEERARGVFELHLLHPSLRTAAGLLLTPASGSIRSAGPRSGAVAPPLWARSASEED